MKKIPVEEAVGKVLYHDITEIVPGKVKGPTFKKGHIIKEEDIPKLLSIGEKHIFVGQADQGFIHENEAAERMAKAATGKGIKLTPPSEGKVTLIAEETGLLKVNVERLEKLNSIDQAMFATLHTDMVVKKDMEIAGTRVIPLVIDENKIIQIEELCKEGPIIEILPIQAMKAAIITTGSEVYEGLIEDKFGPVLKSKLENLGGQVIEQVFSTDDVEMMVGKIDQLLELKPDILLLTGGMSVDPDDITPTAIKEAGAEIISYGAPSLPGAMFMMAYIDDLPVLGLPACVMYSKTTVFDLILPKVMAGERISKKDIVRIGHGGFCTSCEVCTYPNCWYGKF